MKYYKKHYLLNFYENVYINVYKVLSLFLKRYML